MPSAYLANIAQVNLNGTYLGEQVQNTLWFDRGPAPPVGATLAVLGANIASWWDTQMQPIQSTQYVLENVTVLDWASGIAPVHVQTAGLPLTGQNVNLPVPGNAALCVTFRTAGRGRSSRGRNYIAGLTENVLTGNYWETAVRDGVVNAYEGLNSFTSVNGWTHVVVSQFTNGSVRGAAVAQNVIAYTADLAVDSMRRRLAGRGR